MCDWYNAMWSELKNIRYIFYSTVGTDEGERNRPDLNGLQEITLSLLGKYIV